MEKVAAGETNEREGAPHNVDEAWAFFRAEAEGLEATARKREEDFRLEDELTRRVFRFLADAQRAARAGDAFALEQARAGVRGALNHVFALAVTKYAREGIDDEVARAEGLAFSWGLEGDLPARRLQTVRRAFGRQAGFRPALEVRETLSAAREELGLPARVPAFEG